MRIVLAGLVFLVLAACGGTGALVTPAASAPLPAYSLTGSGPILIVLEGDIKDTLTPGGQQDYVQRVPAAGYSMLTLNLPCSDDFDTQLSCWATTIKDGDTTLFQRFCAGLSDVLDTLNKPVAGLIGVSRGAYVGLTCAANDSRIKNIAAIIPVTDLNYLTEFAGPLQVNESEFGLEQYYPELREKRILVRIGKDDTRVGTDNAVNFANDVGATLQLLDTVGHSAPEDGSTFIWLAAQPGGEP